MVHSDESILNNHQINPTLELIDIDDEPDNHSRKDVSDFFFSFFTKETIFERIQLSYEKCLHE